MSKDSKIHTTYTTKDILEYSKSHTFSKKNLLRLALAKKQAFKELYHNGMHQIQANGIKLSTIWIRSLASNHQHIITLTTIKTCQNYVKQKSQ